MTIPPATSPHGHRQAGSARGYIAVDLGASTGRVILGIADGRELTMSEVHRFASSTHQLEGHPVWDTATLYAASIEGIGKAVAECAARGVQAAGIGVDSWGVDHALLAPDGTLSPVDSYRGARDPAPVIARRTLTEQEVFARSGITDQSINSALRLGAKAATTDLTGHTLLFLPDLWTYWLTGAVGTERTIASTSQLLDVATGEFSPDLAAAVGLAGLNLPPVSTPGALAGQTTPEVTTQVGAAEAIPVYRVAGHDTASAFAFATPGGDREGLIASGTWSLVGLCLPRPVTSSAAHTSGFTNELGADGVLFLRNLSGMWLLQECLRQWAEEDGVAPDLPELLTQAAGLPHDPTVFDVSDSRLLPAGGMPERIAALCRESGRMPPTTRAQWARAVIDSLAAAYVDTIAEACALTTAKVDRIRIVGGGARNELLCQLTADLSGKPVVAGPVEASSIGNIAVQAVADGAYATVAEAQQHLQGDTGESVAFTPATNRAQR